MATNPNSAKRGSGKPTFVGLRPKQVTEEIAKQIGEQLQTVVHRKKPQMMIVSLRALPTSVTETADGIQFVANTIVTDGADAARPRSLDSVVTLGHKGRQWTVAQVKVPALGVGTDD